MVTVETGRRVLLVDDELTIRDALSDLLELEGFEVERAADGAEALEKLRLQCPDLIVLDLMMPRMNGWDLLDLRRNELLCADAPVIVMSAHRQMKASVQPFNVAAALEKPFDVDDLLRAIDRVLSA